MRDDLYSPGPDGTPWERAAPEAAGFDAKSLEEAVAFARAHETPWERDLAAVIAKGHFEEGPWSEIIGPTRPRGDPNGLILRHGRIVARWGDTRRVDMTFSVAKSYLSILAGVAVADGLIADLDAPVGVSVRDGGFEGPHNGAITWRHLLQQTSEWEGTLWGKPDLVDRNRDLSLEGRGKAKGTHRDLAPPGRHWEYNDVRVNRFSLALLRRFAQALPEVFAERIMAPIGASESWAWRGYRNSVVEIGGKPVESVSGGGHWGGGMFIHAEDQARIGLLMLRRGRWGARQVLDERWIAFSTEPCPIKPDYGFLWWLNRGHARHRAASAESFFAVGAGGNVSWIDPATGIVAVSRWLAPAAYDGFVTRVMAAFRD
ncbi:MAG TPA: serine hydrolase [Stellaceae bacterium]|nr:serine hydrolase [Stellaceae bacterium]